MALDARRLKTVENVFGIEAAGLLLADILPPWLLDLNLLVEPVEAGRPPGAPADWQPGRGDPPAVFRSSSAATACSVRRP